MPKNIVEKTLKESLKAMERFFSKKNIALVAEAAELIASVFKDGGKLMIVGNGGSAADAQHLAAEFVNRFEIERPPLPAMALTTDSSVLTSIGNDYDFNLIFSKQIKAIGAEGDVLLAISTSGGSANVIKAVEAARKMNIKTISLTGGGGGKVAEKSELSLNVSYGSTARIQEVHILVCHMLCELVDKTLFTQTS
jgi:D-sedoheptulose 7-phosphate isomerase